MEHQLAEYKKFKEAAGGLNLLLQNPLRFFSRESFVGQGVVFYPPEKITSEDLRKAFSKVLGEIPVVEKLEQEMIKEVLTLEEKIVHLQETLRQKVQTSFAELIANATDKVEVVVSFLAMLEMVKQKLIHVEQGELFSEIRLKYKEIEHTNI